MIERDEGEAIATIEDATSGNFASRSHESCTLPPDIRMLFITSNTLTYLQDEPEASLHHVGTQLIGMVSCAEDFIQGNWSSLVLVLPEQKTVIGFGGYFEEDGEFACGNRWPKGPHNHVVQCCLEDLAVFERASMLYPRFAPGVIQVSSCIYLFGGGKLDNMTLCQSEMYSLQTDTWTAIQPMPTPKRTFNPALHHSDIYLIGGWGTSCSYVYNIPSDQYTLLPFSLPSIGEQGLTLIRESTLVFLSIGKRYVFRIELFQLETERVDTEITVFPRSCVAPIHHKDYSYATAVFKTEDKFARYFARYSWRNEEYRLIEYFKNEHDPLR
jgi:hypothetical protein